MPAKRVDVFIDGFNFYYGLMESDLGHLRWLDWVSLGKRLNTADDRELRKVWYFTAPVNRDPEKERRQSTYLGALRYLYPDPTVFEVVLGRIQWEPTACRHCQRSFDRPVEKHTDVNLATQMVLGASRHEFDVAMLISGDADQAAAVRGLVGLGVEVRVVFPPNRRSSHLKDLASTAYDVKVKHLEGCQLPDHIATSTRQTLTRPAPWRGAAAPGGDPQPHG